MTSIEITDDELRFFMDCSSALLYLIPDKSLPTYSHFTREQIVELMIRFRAIADANGVEL